MKPTEERSIKKRLYTWDRKWIRPFESPVSIYMNFMMINCLRAGDTCRYWKCRHEPKLMYREEFKNTVKGGCGFVSALSKHLLCESVAFPKITGLYGYKSDFCYCPECIRQGYHSLLSQLPFEECCPIHGVLYEDLHKEIPIGMDYTDYKEIFGAFPLPPKRKEQDYTKVKERAERYVNVDTIAYASSVDNYHDPIEPDNRVTVAELDPDFEYGQYIDRLWERFGRVAAEVYPNDPVLITNYDSLRNSVPVQYYGRAMEITCLLEYIRDVDKTEYPGDYPIIRNEKISQLMPSTSENIKASFCYAVRGSRDLSDIFDLKYLLYANSYIAKDIDKNHTTLLQNLDLQINRLPLHFWGMISNPDDLLYVTPTLSAICIEDQFRVQSVQHEQMLASQETIDFYHEWERINPLVYEINVYRDGRIVIYRIITK